MKIAFKLIKFLSLDRPSLCLSSSSLALASIFICMYLTSSTWLIIVQTPPPPPPNPMCKCLRMCVRFIMVLGILFNEEKKRERIKSPVHNAVDTVSLVDCLAHPSSSVPFGNLFWLFWDVPNGFLFSSIHKQTQTKSGRERERECLWHWMNSTATNINDDIGQSTQCNRGTVGEGRSGGSRNRWTQM